MNSRPRPKLVSPSVPPPRVPALSNFTTPRDKLPAPAGARAAGSSAPTRSGAAPRSGPACSLRSQLRSLRCSCGPPRVRGWRPGARAGPGLQRADSGPELRGRSRSAEAGLPLARLLPSPGDEEEEVPAARWLQSCLGAAETQAQAEQTQSHQAVPGSAACKDHLPAPRRGSPRVKSPGGH